MLIVIVKYFEVTSSIPTEVSRRKSLANESASDAYIVQGSANTPNSLEGEVLPDGQQICEVEASPGIMERAPTERNANISRPIVAHSKPRMKTCSSS